MKRLVYLLSCSLLPLTLIQADDHGGVHVHLPACENEQVVDCEDKIPAVCIEQRPWYHNQHYDEYENIEDQADRLQDDTAWPGQREDFSDYLLR